MSSTNKYELKIIFRSGWITLLSIVLFILIGFASYNGYTSVTKRNKQILKEKALIAADDAKVLDQISRIHSGEDLNLKGFSDPTNPLVIGYGHPRLVAMEAKPLTFIATGQSDLYSHTVKPLIYGQLFDLDYAEICNPVQLLFGTFDVSFVLVFIIPLIIIAFTYNILSKERELGTLRLVASQPLSIQKWLYKKMGLRFVIFTSISMIILLFFIILFGHNVSSRTSDVLLLLILVLGYELFWFSLAFLINLKGYNSSKNAIALIGLWLLLTLVFPALVSQVSKSVYPMPSRLVMLNETREIEKEIKERQNEVLADFLQDHPELADKKSKEKEFGFWHKYFASQDMLTQELQPILNKYKEALTNQQQIIGMFKYFSPSLLMSDTLNNIAGTSSKSYQNYKKQAFEFASQWRSHIQILLFSNKKYTMKVHQNRPVFNYNPLEVDSFFSIVVLFVFSVIIIVFSFSLKRTII